MLLNRKIEYAEKELSRCVFIFNLANLYSLFIYLMPFLLVTIEFPALTFTRTSGKLATLYPEEIILIHKL